MFGVLLEVKKEEERGWIEWIGPVLEIKVYLGLPSLSSVSLS